MLEQRHDAMNMGSSSPMQMVFTNSQSTPLYSTSWTPTSTAQYAGTCLFLILLAMTLRGLLAAKHILEIRWSAQAHDRRYVVVQGRTPESGNIENSPDAKDGSLITAQGVEERVKVVRSVKQQVIPFRLSVDVPRAGLTFVIVGIAYLL